MHYNRVTYLYLLSGKQNLLPWNTISSKPWMLRRPINFNARLLFHLCLFYRLENSNFDAFGAMINVVNCECFHLCNLPYSTSDEILYKNLCKAINIVICCSWGCDGGNSGLNMYPGVNPIVVRLLLNTCRYTARPSAKICQKQSTCAPAIQIRNWCIMSMYIGLVTIANRKNRGNSFEKVCLWNQYDLGG